MQRRSESVMSCVARTVAMLGLMAACVPPNGAWQSQQGYQGQSYGSAPSSGYSNDEYSDDSSGDYSGDYGSDASGGYNGGYASRGSSVGGNCASVCSKIEQCRLMKADRCGELCELAANDGHTWRIDNEPCSAIRKAFVHDKWVCTAEASYGTSYGNGPTDYRNQSIMGTGNTRDEAGYQALKDCGSLMGVNNNREWSSGARVEGGDCKVTKCQPPGSPVY